MSEANDDDEAPKEPECTGRSTRLFQIYEPDLAELEAILPDLCSALYGFIETEHPTAVNKIRVKLRRAKQILSNVRWDYGPPSDVISIPG